MISSTQQRDRAIVIAHRHGVSLAQLGRVNGLSRARVKTIVDRARLLEQLARTQAGELSARTRNALVADLGAAGLLPASVQASYTLQVLLRVPNIGAKSRKEINDWLKRYGLGPIA